METKDHSIVAGVPAELFDDRVGIMTVIDMMFSIKKLAHEAPCVVLPVDADPGEDGSLIFSIDGNALGAVSREYAGNVMPFISKYEPFLSICIVETPPDAPYEEKYVTFFVMECDVDDEGARKAEDFTFCMDDYHGSDELDTRTDFS